MTTTTNQPHAGKGCKEATSDRCGDICVAFHYKPWIRQLSAEAEQRPVVERSLYSGLYKGRKLSRRLGQLEEYPPPSHPRSDDRSPSITQTCPERQELVILDKGTVGEAFCCQQKPPQPIPRPEEAPKGLKARNPDRIRKEVGWTLLRLQQGCPRKVNAGTAQNQTPGVRKVRNQRPNRCDICMAFHQDG